MGTTNAQPGHMGLTSHLSWAASSAVLQGALFEAVSKAEQEQGSRHREVCALPKGRGLGGWVEGKGG